MVQGLVQFPGSGCVVEFMHGNGPQIAWVLEENNGKVRLLLPNRRETSLTLARILPWAGPSYAGVTSREGAVDILQRHREAREKLKQAVDVRALWALAQGEVPKASAAWLAELGLSDPDVDAVAACGQALLECKSHFKFSPPDFEIYSEDTVAAREAEAESQRLREAFARQGQTWIAHLWDIHQKRKRPGEQEPELLPEVESRLRDLIAERLVDPDASTEEATWRLLVKGLPDDPHLALYLAEAWGLVEPHYNFWLDRADYHCGDEWADDFAEAIGTLIEQGREARLETLDKPFVSVDSAETRDIDDALHVEPRAGGGWRVTVALACPALNWPFGSDLDKAVQHRATSLYLPEATHHMLPEILSTDAFTLTDNDSRPALIVYCDVAGDGTILKFSPACARVTVKDNLTYETVEEALNHGSGPAASHRAMLRQAHDLAEAREACRLRHNAVIIDRPDPAFKVHHGETHGDVKVSLHDSPDVPQAHLIVSEVMILVNVALAHWAAEHGAALFHRTQDVTIPKEYAGKWSRPEDIARVVKVLTPASLEVSPRPHAGLGEPLYAPTTSPLRRYSDLVNEAQVLHVLRQGAPRWTKAELEAMLPIMGQRLERASHVQRVRPRYWKLYYIRQHGDKHWWPGVITEENDAFVSVSLPREQLFLRARRSMFDDRCHPGQPVEVRLHKVHPLRNEIHIAQTREPSED